MNADSWRHVPNFFEASTASPNAASTPAGSGESSERSALSNPATPLFPAPDQIGPYRILGLLGEGGMGVVYEAVQEDPHRVIALKVIKSGLVDPGLLRRFQQESQALGRLQHPGIGQIYQAGVAETKSGTRHYFAMELIRGQSLLDYANSKNLDTRDRLKLMIKICEAVQHAHQRGLIHRDLKPGNILVDESGQTKILDFGVARATDSDAQATRQTDLGQLIGTLAYMSPEQVFGDSAELDTRSDVYALGVILYELLAGYRPYRAGQKLHELVQTIREQDPVPLGCSNRMYRGDLEIIVAKALEKDRTRRYGMAVELAEDLRRYLNDEPIVARPPSTRYQLQKLARRHKGLVLGMAVVFLVLLIGIAASTRQAALARQERNRALAEKQRADTEAGTAKAVNDFLQNDLLRQASAYAQANPAAKPDPDLKVRTALARAAAGIAGKFAAQPAVEASIRQTIGSAYWDLGLFPEAQKQMERALTLRGRVLGPEHPDTLESMMTLADLNREEGKFAAAEALFSTVVDIRSRRLGPEHSDTLAALSGLVAVYIGEGKDSAAEILMTRILATRSRFLGPDHPDTLDSMNTLSVIYTDQGKYGQAEPLASKLLAADLRFKGVVHPDTLLSMSSLAWVYLREGKFAKAELLAAEALERRRRVLGPQHPDTLESMAQLAKLYSLQGKYAQAESLYTRVLPIQSRLLGVEHPDTTSSMNNLGLLYGDEGKYGQAEPLLLKVLATNRRVQGEQHPDTLTVMGNLAFLYRRQKKYAQAATLYSRVIEGRRRALGVEHPATASALDSLGWIRLQQRGYMDAESLLREALTAQQKLSPESWERYNSQSLLGASLERQGEYRSAEPLLLAGYEGLLQQRSAIPFDSRFAMEDAAWNVVRLYRDWGKPDKAAEWQRRVQLSPARGLKD